MHKTCNKNFLSIFISLILLALLIMTIWVFMKYSPQFVDNVIADDIQKLHKIFDEIDQNCQILGFEHEKNYIDFLNVIKFAGSEVGSMNLIYPEHWKGPYLKDNPTAQEKYYQIVETKKGYYITPGDGVKLANGNTIGKDIILNKNADISAMTIDPNLLLTKDGRPLAAKIQLRYKGTENFLAPVVQDGYGLD